MDLSTRKILFIQEFLKLESDRIISDFENLLQKEIESDCKYTPMSVAEFESRIRQSEDDSDNGRVTETSVLLDEIEKWS